MTRVSGFEELADELEELSNAFDRIQSRKGTDADASGAIEEGVRRAMDREIVPEAQREARQHVPTQDAQTISHERGEWAADRYRHFFYATSDLVRYHEFGTGGRATDPAKGTTEGTDFRGRPGYIIRPRGDYPLGIPDSRWNGPNWMVNSNTGKVHFEYVVHPGVHAKHFMRRALEDNAQEMRGFILAQINQMFRENGLM